MTPITVGIIAICGSLLLMTIGMPIAFSFMVTGLIGFIYLVGFEPGMLLLSIHPFAWASAYALMPLPLFMFMSILLSKVEITGDLFNAAAKWTGRLPGSLAMASVLACTGFAAICGSSVASATAMGYTCVPQMRRFGYDTKLATGVVAAGGTLGILIPPSGTFILLGVLVEVSVGKLFLAGILPGLLLSAALLIAVYVRVKLDPSLAPALPSVSWKEKFQSLKTVAEVPILFIIIMGGIYSGLCTATESGALGACTAILMAMRRRKLTWKVLSASCKETVGLAAMTTTILIGAMIFQSLLAVTRLPSMLSEYVAGLAVAPLTLLFMVMGLYIFLGCIMEVLAMVVLTVPILFPVLVNAGFDPVHLCIVIVVMMELGMITPPVGINVFVIKGLVPDVPMEDIFRGVFPFIIAMLVIIIILMVYPEISLYLVKTMM
jgi:C4-dicarboxylate transporter DctM subunit